MSRELEEGTELQLDFEKIGKIAASGSKVIPAVAQDVDTRRVLIVGYVNQDALETALERKLAVFWSTSRDELWIKGATSGDTLELVEARVNCEQNSVLYLVRVKGSGACHTRDHTGRSRTTCFYRTIVDGELKQVAPEPAAGTSNG